ncbi:MAG: hypothetical protein ACI31E_03135, partial [Muribaculaceae bacterium]
MPRLNALAILSQNDIIQCAHRKLTGGHKQKTPPQPSIILRFPAKIRKKHDKKRRREKKHPQTPTALSFKKVLFFRIFGYFI